MEQFPGKIRNVTKNLSNDQNHVALGYCREQKEFAFEIASRVVSTKQVMQ